VSFCLRSTSLPKPAPHHGPVESFSNQQNWIEKETEHGYFVGDRSRKTGAIQA
jgi:hypothetical protein